MKTNNSDIMKLFDFILENKDIIISENGLFSRDTLRMIRAIVKGKMPNDFILSEDQRKVIIDSFLRSNRFFDSDTPEVILSDKTCAFEAVKRNIYSANYSLYYSSDYEKVVVEIALNNNYILSSDSPDFLKKNFKVALNSIRLNPKSADFVNWDVLNENQKTILIDEVIISGYIIDQNSCDALKGDTTVVLASIKEDMNNIKYASKEATNDPLIFKHLLLNGYRYENYEIVSKSIKQFLDIKVFEKVNEILGLHGDNDSEEYISRFTKLYYEALTTLPKISTFEIIFLNAAEEKWEKERRKRPEKYQNIFGKICSELRNNDNLDKAISKLSFFNNMTRVLDVKFLVLYDSIKEFHEIYHSNRNDKLNLIQNSKNTISKFSALYIAKCKEECKKNAMDVFYKYIKNFYRLKTDNPIVHKTIVQRLKKEKLRKKFLAYDKDVIDYVQRLVKRYNDVYDTEFLYDLVTNFIVNNKSKLEEFIKVPKYYDCYKRYERASKLIVRLNKGNIDYNGPEVANYRDIIKYNGTEKKYKYCGIPFNKKELATFSDFRKKEMLFENLKKNITQKANTLNIDGMDPGSIIFEIEDNFPFNDTFFEFDKKILNKLTLKNIISECMDDYEGIYDESLLDDTSYDLVKTVYIDNGIFWLLALKNLYSCPSLSSEGIMKTNIIPMIDNMYGVAHLIDDFKITDYNYDDIKLLSEINDCADTNSIAILGIDIVKKLSKNKAYTNDDAEEIIKIATELVAQMVKRNRSTVPYINGSYGEYKYSMYDHQDTSILTSGIDTDACFRVDGNDNDFLHYCALNKNGFVLKITDSFDNLIARASGFRNGNCIFINQLRTIYDKGGNGDKPSHISNEKKDIIKIFEKACNDIINTSQNNPRERDKIDFVFVNKSYSLNRYKGLFITNDVVTERIGYSPMENESRDWDRFVENTKNLEETKNCDFFTTDYGSYEIICVASSGRKNGTKKKDLKFYEVAPVYERKRTPIVATKDITRDVHNKLNSICGINAYLSNEEYESAVIPENSLVLYGDNWFIVYNNGELVDFCLLEFDKKAQREFNIAEEVLNNISKDKKNISTDEIISKLIVPIEEEDKIKQSRKFLFKKFKKSE